MIRTDLYPLKKRDIILFQPDVCNHFINLLFPSGLLPQALFCVSFKVNSGMEQHFVHSYEELEQLLQSKQATTNLYCDCYITPNSFYAPKRQCKFVHKLNYLFIDIDNHNDIVDQHSINSLLYHLQEEYFNVKIPEPTFVVSTGRGLQLYYKIPPLSYNDKTSKFWRKVEQGLIDNMEDLNFNGFAVDTKVKDAPRLLRLAGTYNTKSKTYAEIAYYSDKEYTLTEISQGYVFGCITTGRKYKKYKGNKHITAISKGRYRVNANSSVSNAIYTKEQELKLLEQRLQDLSKLVELRQGDLKGCRQSLIWQAGNILRQLDITEQEKTVYLQDINNRFSEPLPDSEIQHELYRKDIYKRSNNKLIELLQISTEEQLQLSTIKYSTQKLNKELQKAERKKHKEETLKQVQYMSAAGKTQKQIAVSIGVSVSTIKKYYKELGINKAKISNKVAVVACKEAGFTQAETAKQLNISIRTVREYWHKGEAS